MKFIMHKKGVFPRDIDNDNIPKGYEDQYIVILDQDKIGFMYKDGLVKYAEFLSFKYDIDHNLQNKEWVYISRAEVLAMGFQI